MLSTFFSTSRPIHYLMVFIMVTIAIVSSLWWNVDVQWWEMTAILILPASLAIFEFVVSKNELTPSSGYALWITAVLSLLYLTFNINLSAVIALLLILLSLRRLLSLKSGHAAIKKIFDATFLITIATIFYHWSALFYIVIFVSIFLYVRNDYRNWLSPFIAMGCVWFLLFTYDYVWENQVIDTLWESYETAYLWNNDLFTSQQVILLILLTIAVIGLLVYISKLIEIQQSIRPRFTIIMFTGLSSIAIALIDFESFTHGGFLFLIPSISIFIARFAHSVNHRIIIELLLWLPVVVLLTSFLLY